MIDPRLYDDVERLAMSRVGQWSTIHAFRPAASRDFPVRITELGEIRYLVTARHDGADAERVLREMRGARPADIAILGDAVRRFAAFHALFANRSRARVPVAGLLHHYSVLRKLRGFPGNGEILDLGGALGLLPFLFARDSAPRLYNQVEAMQSLYVLRSAISSFAFRDRFEDLAAGGTAPDRLLSPDGMPPRPSGGGTIDIGFDGPAACTLHPWWRVHEAFDRPYDVILCDESACELDETAFAYFAKRALSSLKPNGVLFLHGLGRPGGDRERLARERLGLLAGFGFRSLITGASFDDGGPLARPNHVLIGPRHEHYAVAMEDIQRPNFDTGSPLVRSVYGLDEPQGEIAEAAALRREMARLLAGGAA